MTHRQGPLARVRGANPVPVPVDPDWERVKEHVATVSRAEADSGLAESAGAHVRTPLVPGVERAATAPGRWNARGSRRILAAVVLCAAVATGILVGVAPGGDSPDFLARAAAALTPEPGTILYERWEHTIAFEPGRMYGPEQLWIEEDSPHRYRAILEPGTHLPAEGLAYAYGVNLAYAGGGRPLANGLNEWLNRLQRVLSGQPLELAGSVQAPAGQGRPGEVRRTLTFLPPNQLLSIRLRVTLGASLPGPHDQAIENGADPVSALREAIAEGRAHEAGTAQLDGRTMQRIDLDLPPHSPATAPRLPVGAPPRLPAGAPVSHSEAYAYVEPETFHPVEIVYGLDTYRFLAYEYLPETPANLALTNIQAQHRHAIIVKADAARK